LLLVLNVTVHLLVRRLLALLMNRLTPLAACGPLLLLLLLLSTLTLLLRC
jgi:hypothetical protein